MPRKARIDAPEAIQQIIVRGIERNQMLYNDIDFGNFFVRLTAILLEATAPCYAWALIPNRLPSRIHTGKVLFVTGMRLLAASAVWFYRRHRRQGTLLQNRYKSILGQQT